ncbi:MAG: modified peptide precursor CbpA [Desulfomonile sp.]|nr:modified peptide precursor CbpA [Desulfomonile sp.]
MAKVKPCTFMVTGFFYFPTKKGGEEEMKDVIAYRKTCSAEGTGLSHYILTVATVK